jgi:hypothetical protein
MNDVRCTQCGAVGLEPGFVETPVQGASGYALWIEGLLELGLFGGVKTRGRRRFQIHAYRCARCGHLELFAA